MCRAVLEFTWRPVDRLEPADEAIIKESVSLMPNKRTIIVLTMLSITTFVIPIILAVLLTPWWLFGFILFALVQWYVYRIDKRKGECESILTWYGLKS